jgi:hypothetical protein
MDPQNIFTDLKPEDQMATLHQFILQKSIIPETKVQHVTREKNTFNEDILHEVEKEVTNETQDMPTWRKIRFSKRLRNGSLYLLFLSRSYYSVYFYSLC